MKSSELRKKFFKFFGERGHSHVSSSSLIPPHDPTLLFTNAGMNQFKDLFLGFEKRSYSRAVTIQKCVRAGGKHNDLDNVGFTKRHLTFFEMMGNFSFNDYFKKEAIDYAWTFLTQEILLPIDKLHVTVFNTDDEAYDIWKNSIGIASERIHRLGEKDNFWQMGDIGPCGPCSEIHIDRGPDFGCSDQCSPACDCDRFLEIWNLVFMQYNRLANGKLEPLSQRGVDTGMGLERLAVLAQQKESVFQIDLFEPLIKATEKLTGLVYSEQSDDKKAAFHVLADHIRSTTLLSVDGCAPSNDGRGYVLRKIIRRAALFSQKLTQNIIFPELVSALAQTFSDVYPELVVNENAVKSMLYAEIEKFSDNLSRGKEILEQYCKESCDTKVINGAQAFKLYDTYGFPLELVVLIARERAYTVDIIGFEKEMEKQRGLSGKKHSDSLDYVKLDEAIKTEFTGYQELETSSSVIALVEDEKSVPSVQEGRSCWVITRKSPFFIVGGGQVPDQGSLVIDDYSVPINAVRYIAGRIAVHIEAPCDIMIGTTVTSRVDRPWRTDAMKNHTATHLLQAALIEVFGHSIKQSGSLVRPDYLRFDFTYHDALSFDDITRIEECVNAKIRENIAVITENTTLKDALHRGALAFFGDKYDSESVRIVQVDDFSVELCGGTHVNATGDIGVFKIIENSSLSAGHRRIVAVTGSKAVMLFQSCFNAIKVLGQEFKVKRDEVLSTVLSKQEESKKLSQELDRLKQESWKSLVPSWIEEAKSVSGTAFLMKEYSADTSVLRDIAVLMADKKEGLYCIVTHKEDAFSYVCTLSPSLQDKISMRSLGLYLKENYHIKGGGTHLIQQGSGPAGIKDSLEEIIVRWLDNSSKQKS